MKEIIIHCSSEEEWNKVQEKMFRGGIDGMILEKKNCFIGKTNVVSH